MNNSSPTHPTPDPTAILHRWLAPRVSMDPGAAAAEVIFSHAQNWVCDQ